MASDFHFRGKFATVVIAVQVIFIVIFAFFVEYDEDADASATKHNVDPSKGGQLPIDNMVTPYYSMFQDIHAMIFFGIGFLYAFMKKYGYMGLGMNMLLAAISVQLAIITQNVWHMVNGKIHLSVISLLLGDFAAASSLIALGGVFGKVSPLQMVIFTIFEIFFYSIIEHFSVTLLQISDMGEAVCLHMFAGLFGLSVAYVVDRNKEVKGHPDESTSYVSNLFCMLGTIFLWSFWPSFNSSLAVGDLRHRSAINTLLALLASCVTAFAASSFLTKGDKFNMTHIQNATLAGGVSIGTVTNLMIGPATALAVGGIAGCISVAGYKYVTPFLSKRLKIHDPCGINSLHAIPGFFAGFLGIAAAFMATEKNYGYTLYKLYPAMAPEANTTALYNIQSHLSDVLPGDARTPSSQAVFQLVYIIITIVFGIATGLVTGFVLRIPFFDPLKREQMYTDELFWEMPQELPKETANKIDLSVTKF